MNLDKYFGGRCEGFVAFLLVISLPGVVLGQDEYSFDLSEYENKAFEWGGFGELRYEYFNINQESIFGKLNTYKDPRPDLNRLSGVTEIKGSYKKERFAFNFLGHAQGSQDEYNWNDNAEIYEASMSLKPHPSITFDLGKKVFKWGKGYAWNPVGFIDRAKDPNNPEEALEGYIAAAADLVKSYEGPLSTTALTIVGLPVWDNVNEEFGEIDNVNLAAKLYFLLYDTDIDFVLFSGNSRSNRYGMDFSKNLATNFEIHGELAYIPDARQKFLDNSGVLQTRTVHAINYLTGMRYLTENDITIIAEYYHTDEGFSVAELDTFYGFVDTAYQDYLLTGSDALLQNAFAVSQSGYARPQISRNYLYLKINQKEPFDWLYFTPGLTTIYNADDHSYSVTPEAVYTGFTNWELRVRYAMINGGQYTEYGEKQNNQRAEIRVRYFF